MSQAASSSGEHEAAGGNRPQLPLAMQAYACGYNTHGCGSKILTCVHRTLTRSEVFVSNPFRQITHIYVSFFLYFSPPFSPELIFHIFHLVLAL